MNPLKMPEGSVRALIALAIVLSVIAVAIISLLTGREASGMAIGALLSAFGSITEKYFTDRKQASSAMRSDNTNERKPQ